jgi:hypothetical protein
MTSLPPSRRWPFVRDRDQPPAHVAALASLTAGLRTRPNLKTEVFVLDNDSLTNDELRGFEAQVDVRFKAIADRFVMADERFIALDERLAGIEQELQALGRRSEARCKAIERRIEATQTQTEHVRTLLAARLDHARRDLARIVLLGLLGTTISTAALCLATIVLAL